MSARKKTVAVLLGGWSAEREVSLVSGKACAKALKEAGYTVKEIDVSRDLKKLAAELDPLPDVVFNALHGRGGEDGCIQGVLDMLGVPYTHSGRLASALAMDKQRTKEVLSTKGIRSPKGIVVTLEQAAGGKTLPPPYVAKPVCEGSSVGVYIIRPGDNRNPFTPQNWAHGDGILIEEYIPGRELTVAVMSAANEQTRALAVTEIIPRTEFYDYEAKYATGGSVHEIPAKIPAEIEKEVCRMAVVAHETLGCSGISRSDFRYDPEKPGTQGLYFLETNTQPGMTPTSLVPEQAAHMGMSFAELVSWMVENAQCHG